MSKLVIPGLKPEDSVKFYLTGEFYGENPSSISFNIDVPKACPLISKTNINLKVEDAKPENVAGPNALTFNFNRYSKLNLPKQNRYKLRLTLTTKSERGTLKIGDTVLVNAGGDLSSLNGNVFTIIGSGLTSNGQTAIIELDVRNTYNIPNARGSVSGSITEKYRKETYKKFTITTPKNVFDNLINVRNPLKGTLVSQVIDIPIYAYKNFEGNDSVKEPRLLLFNKNITINEKTPPEYNPNGFVPRYLQGNSYSAILRSDEKRNFLFYVAIARYRYANNKWSGQWLQVNKEDKAIWGKAVR